MLIVVEYGKEDEPPVGIATAVCASSTATINEFTGKILWYGIEFFPFYP